MVKIFKNYPLALILSAFCPYLSIQLGLRVDHLVIYPMLYLTLLTYLAKPTRGSRHLIPLLSMWMFTLLFLVIRTILGHNSIDMSMIPEADNFLQPFAIMLFFAGVYSSLEQVQERLLKLTSLFVWLLCLNTIWIIIGFTYDLHGINEYFWRGPESVAFYAETMGRYSGIFNQPAEAGMAYSIGLVALNYVMNRTEKLSPKHAIIMILLLFGGIVTVSKIFLFGGIPLFLFAVVTSRKLRKQTFKLMTWIVILSYPPYYYISHTWDGLFFLLRFIDGSSQQGLVNLLTAGRFGGEQSQQSRFFSEVWNENPVYGAGFGEYKIVDSAFFHFFGNGGLVAITMYILMLGYLLHVGFNFLRQTNYNHESKFFTLLIITVVGGSIGAPVFTLNRSSIILWVFICILLQYYYVYRKEGLAPFDKRFEITIKDSPASIIN